MSGFDNETMYANNYDFRGVQPVIPQVTTAGQLPIGTGASPAIEVGSLTSPDGSITIGYSAPNITLQAAASLPYISISPFIVGTDIHSGYSTIQAGIDAAHTAGATRSTPLNVYIKPKTDLTAYTENLTLYDGINLIGFSGATSNNFAQTFTTIRINGTLTFAEQAACEIVNINIVAGNNTAVTVPFTIRLSLSNSQITNSGANNLFSITSAITSGVNIYGTDSTLSSSIFINDNGIGAALSIIMDNSQLSGTVTLSSTNSSIFKNLSNCTISNDFTANCNSSVNITYNYCSLSCSTWTFTGTTAVAIKLNWCNFGTPPTISMSNSASTIQLMDCVLAAASTFSTPNFTFLPSFYQDLKGWNLRDFSNTGTGVTPLGFSAAQFTTKQEGLQTTSGSAQTLATIAVAAGTTMLIKGVIAGANAGHTDMTGGSYEVLVDGTAAAIVGSPSLNIQATSTGTFAASFSGGNLLIQVTAPSAAAYNWVTTYQYQPMISNA